MLDLNSTKRPAPVEREELFTLNGVVGTIPVEFEASAALFYADAVRKFGGEAAGSWALEYALTDFALPEAEQDKAYKELLLAERHVLSNEQLGVLMHICIQRILGKQVAIPGPKAPAPVQPEPETLPEPAEDPIYQGVKAPLVEPTWPEEAKSDFSNTSSSALE